MEEYLIPQKKRKLLGSYIKKIREKIGLELNQISERMDIPISLYSRLEYGKLAKINPFLLKKIALELKIDYLELYKIVGYLNEEDFQKYQKYNKNNNPNIIKRNSGNIVAGNIEKGAIIIGNKNYNWKQKKISNKIIIDWLENLTEKEIKKLKLTEDEVKELKKYAEFLKIKRR